MAKEVQTGVEDPSAANLEKPGVTVPGVVPPEGTPAAVGNQDEVAGLKAATVAEREKRQATEVENQTLRDQMAVIAQQTPQPQEKTSLSQAVAKQLGIDIQVATAEEVCQINEGVLQIMSGQQSEQTFINSHSDYAKVVGTTLPGGQFQAAPPLLRQLHENPALSNALQNSPNKAVLAYSIASKDPQYLTELADAAKSSDTKAAENAEVKINAANQQLSVSAVKEGGGTLDKAAEIRAMSDEEFAEHNRKIMDKAL